MDIEEARYIVRYFGRLMTKHEQLAHRHLMGVEKATRGRSDAEAQKLAPENETRAHTNLLSKDPAVLELAKDGYEAFLIATAERLKREQRDEIILNLCPKCGNLAKTPKAKQCRFCFHDWH